MFLAYVWYDNLVESMKAGIRTTAESPVDVRVRA